MASRRQRPKCGQHNLAKWLYFDDNHSYKTRLLRTRAAWPAFRAALPNVVGSETEAMYTA